jgi:hypothetical protein
VSDEIVVVRTFNDRIEADLAASALNAAGIESMIRDDDAGGMQPALALTNGVQVLVRAGDASAAGEILDGASRNVPGEDSE